MNPFNGLFSEEPETEYIPDNLGRLGQGGFVVKPDPEPIGTPSPRFDEFIKAEQSGIGLRDLFGPKPLSIKGPVGPFGPNRRADVGKVETFLSRSGNFDLSPTDGPTGYYGLRLEDSINAFQKANGLKTDGLLNPFGETIKTLAGKIENQLNLPAPEPAGPLPLPGRGAGAIQTNAPLEHLGGKHPQIAEAAPPPKDPLEAFKKADRDSMKRLEAAQKPKPTRLTQNASERTGLSIFLGGIGRMRKIGTGT
ncbi:MAG: peptidoglycan-binding domain-containing protein [Alphaproteobacteria bacterium]